MEDGGDVISCLYTVIKLRPIKMRYARVAHLSIIQLQRPCVMAVSPASRESHRHYLIQLFMINGILLPYSLNNALGVGLDCLNISYASRIVSSRESRRQWSRRPSRDVNEIQRPPPAKQLSFFIQYLFHHRCETGRNFSKLILDLCHFTKIQFILGRQTNNLCTWYKRRRSRLDDVYDITHFRLGLGHSAEGYQELRMHGLS